MRTPFPKQLPGGSLRISTPSPTAFSPLLLLAAILPVALALSLGLPPAAAQGETTGTAALEIDNQSCLACHGRESIAGVTTRGKTLDLFVSPDPLKASVHAGLNCTDCHGGAKTFMASPHNEGQPLTLLCANCHKDENAKYHASVHGIWRDRGDTVVATCVDCHGSHDILPKSNPKSLTNKFNIHKTCGKCHQDQTILKNRDINEKEAVEHFVDSIHGKALLVQGLVVAPTCNDCHSDHSILPPEHPDSTISRERIPDTCGKCHVLVEEVYNKSVHGQLVKNRDARGPVCNTCHTAHEITVPTNTQFRLRSDLMCGRCHGDRLENYRETFHGKALALGREGVAACYDCHGHHDILPASNPLSHISDENRLETCRKCHPKANKNFAASIVHADHTDKARYPYLYYTFILMTSLLIGTFVFFAVHTVMWLFRSMALFTGDSKDFRERKDKIRKDEEEYVRFRPLDRFLHGLVIFSFLLLVITGMPLKFYYTDWAKGLFNILGGQEVAAILHRVGAMITIFYFSVHVIEVVWSFLQNFGRFRDPKTGKYSVKKILASVIGPDSPMPNLQDLKDMIAHNKWFLGKGPKPQFDRWTYWEKFDYLAVFWGVAIIGTSGLIMWFPELFTKVLPGWSINVALIIHSDEALLAAGFIFTFHFFNVHFRPEKFPMDPVIFSGRISRSELEHERGRLLARWEKSGELDKHVARNNEWESWKWIALPAGFIAFCIGVILVVLIFFAMISRLVES